jgi:hypothetical protein
MGADTTSIVLRYRSSRRDIWAWYWRRWRELLWAYWLVIGIAVVGFTLLYANSTHPIGPADVMRAGAYLALALAAMAIYPQFSFKSEERVFIIGPSGIDSTIGAKPAHRDWVDISEITDIGTHIVFTVAATLNAFLVPNRAFGDAAARADFLQRAMAWHVAAVVGA